MRGLFKRAPKSMWDELFSRHDRERQELLQWEDSKASKALKRTSSVETIRRGKIGSATSKKTKFLSDYGNTNALPDHDETNTNARSRSPESCSPRASPPPSDTEDSEGYFTGDEPVPYDLGAESMRYRELDSMSSSSMSSSRSRSRSPSSSLWDMVETSSAEGSSDFEVVHDGDSD
jgi:hypothetical protein